MQEGTYLAVMVQVSMHLSGADCLTFLFSFTKKIVFENQQNLHTQKEKYIHTRTVYVYPSNIPTTNYSQFLILYNIYNNMNIMHHSAIIKAFYN